LSQPYITVEDKTIVITGGCGLLGSNYIQFLLENGARVANFDLKSSIDKMGVSHKNLLNLPVDVTKKSDISEATEKTISHFKQVPCGLVNNAAIDSTPSSPIEENGPFENFPENAWDKSMSVNVKGVFLCSQVVGTIMAREKRGSIVNINSIYGLVSPDQSLYQFRRDQGENYFKPPTYSVSKSALLNFSRYLAVYWAKQGVRVNNLTLAGVFNNQDQRFIDAYNTRIPVGCMAQPQDYFGALLFLLSDASSYMTGSNLVIDGGWTAI
jgi:NAD(P)-dependent dehydrogenase (short-subunit alcohol dehydrogenase family)